MYEFVLTVKRYFILPAEFRMQRNVSACVRLLYLAVFNGTSISVDRFVKFHVNLTGSRENVYWPSIRCVVINNMYKCIYILTILPCSTSVFETVSNSCVFFYKKYFRIYGVFDSIWIVKRSWNSELIVNKKNKLWYTIITPRT